MAPPQPSSFFLATITCNRFPRAELPHMYNPWLQYTNLPDVQAARTFTVGEVHTTALNITSARERHKWQMFFRLDLDKQN